MAQVITEYRIPVTNSPCRSINVTFPNGVLKFRTYWCGYVTSRWLCDILDADDNPILIGVVLTTGIDNLIQGSGIESLYGIALKVVDSSGKMNTTIEGFGNTALLYATVTTEE